MAALDEAFLRAWSTFKIPGFNSYQRLAIEKFVIQKQDTLVNLLTGSAKSLIYQALPIMFDSIFKEQGHIVNYIPATDEIHMEDRNQGLAWTKPNSGIYNTQHSQQTCALRVKLNSFGSRTIKGERTLCTELQKFSSIR